MPIAFSSALYYPYIDIQNERWLRSAVLFWDSIRTIVPQSYKEPYSGRFAKDLEEQGILQPVRVSSDMEEIELLTDNVFDFLTDPVSAGVLLSDGNNTESLIHPDKMPYELREFFDIHPEKLHHRIQNFFHRSSDNHDWYRVGSGFAKFYMTLLATQLANRLGIGLVTESKTADQLAVAVRLGKPLVFSSYPYPDTPYRDRHRSSRYGHFDAHGPRSVLPREVAPGLMFDLILQNIELPQNVSTQKLLKFKNDHQEELALFRREVTRIVSEIPENVTVEALRQAVHDQYNNQVRPAINSLHSSLVAQGWESALNGFMKVSFFSAAPTSAAIYAGVPGHIALLAGVGLSLTASAVLSTNQWRNQRQGSPYSYVLSLKNNNF